MAGGFRSRTASAKRQQATKPQQGKSFAAQKKRTRAAQRTESKVDAPRVTAYDTLRRVHDEGAYANLTLPALLKQRRISGRDAAFATELAYGTLRTQGVLDAVIRECSSRPLEDIAPEVLDALRLGAYQLMYTRVSDHAAVDTSVTLVAERAGEKVKGFANAVLRSVGRTEAEAWLKKLAPADPVARLAFQHAHPEWIARSFSAVLGEQELEAALEADSARPQVHLVARPGQISAEELALIVGGEEGRYSPYCVYLESGDPGSVEPVAQQLAGVQDEGSQLIARALAEVPVADDQGRWLDLCAGPGGKAALLGSLARIDGAKLDAVEISEHRARLIENAVKDLDVTVHVADGRNPGLQPGYDRVLVDAPCSGLGALRRRPEARWRKAESDIAELNSLQIELLRSAIELTKPGGAIVYSTCSPDLRETRGIVDEAVKEGHVREENAHDLCPGMDGAGDQLSVQMWPHRHGTDAMFFAVLRKV
ncbi:RsmB/NOP family class I SAM-dependent RNA methyltransferase [Corynebacterium tapiri]|uniref:MFS transporter n=1 Tax=Corynebacterium tapiri TaxID=1448266 RepID=A0A5C4U4T2_9CORY|nr:transcription antitermination factor NusB [Corynebacterium tapiri]TNL97552.1 MFS transporter [Corynebacterium tapiri]